MTITKKDLADALDKALSKKRVIDDDTHILHHQYIEMELEKRENRKRLWMKFKLSLIGGIALSLLGFLGWLGKLIVEALQSGPHP